MGIKIKGQYMNRSAFQTIKYMKGAIFSKGRYMNGVGFEILARTPVPHLSPSYTGVCLGYKSFNYDKGVKVLGQLNF